MSIEDRCLTPREQTTLIGCIAFFITALIITSITAQKLYNVNILGYDIAIPVGTSLFAFTFLATDVLSEVFGRKIAIKVVSFGFVCRILVLGFLYFATMVEPVIFYENEAAYDSILGIDGAGRIVIAGIITYIFSEFADVFIFDFFKRKHNDKKLYFRNIASTSMSQAIDTGVFVTIAFAGTMPLSVMASIFIGQYVVKFTIALFDTPFVYLIRNYATGRKWNDIS